MATHLPVLLLYGVYLIGNVKLSAKDYYYNLIYCGVTQVNVSVQSCQHTDLSQIISDMGQRISPGAARPLNNTGFLTDAYTDHQLGTTIAGNANGLLLMEVYAYKVTSPFNTTHIAALQTPEMFGGKDFSPNLDIPDLSGKVILVTGGVCAAPAVPGTPIAFLSLDLTSFASIKSAADTFHAASDRLDVLINNAGIMAVPAGTTEEGYEIQFGTNHISHALLTKLLLPTLLRTPERPAADVRIINLTSEGHKLAPTGGILFDKTKLDAQGTWTRCGQSKLANILFTRSLSKKYPSIRSVSVHPGVVRTDLMGPYRESNALVRYTTAIVGPVFWKSIPQGAKNQLWAATTKADELESGAYYTPVGCKFAGSRYSQDPDLAEKLYESTDKELMLKGY